MKFYVLHHWTWIKYHFTVRQHITYTFWWNIWRVTFRLPQFATFTLNWTQINFTQTICNNFHSITFALKHFYKSKKKLTLASLRSRTNTFIQYTYFNYSYSGNSVCVLAACTQSLSMVDSTGANFPAKNWHFLSFTVWVIENCTEFLLVKFGCYELIYFDGFWFSQRLTLVSCACNVSL